MSVFLFVFPTHKNSLASLGWVEMEVSSCFVRCLCFVRVMFPLIRRYLIWVVCWRACLYGKKNTIVTPPKRYIRWIGWIGMRKSPRKVFDPFKNFDMKIEGIGSRQKKSSCRLCTTNLCPAAFVVNPLRGKMMCFFFFGGGLNSGSSMLWSR